MVTQHNFVPTSDGPGPWTASRPYINRRIQRTQMPAKIPVMALKRNANNNTPVLFVLDFNVANATDDPEDPFGSGRIAIGALHDGKLKTLVEHNRRPDGIEIWQEDGGYIFWTQMCHPEENDGVVQRSNLEGKNVETILPSGMIHTPKQLAIDRNRQKLYICDREGMRVFRCNLDGSDLETLIQAGDWNNADHVKDKTRHCVGIAVHGEHFYWTQKGPSKGGKGRIFRAAIHMPAGQTAETRRDMELLFDNLPEPIDLLIDSESDTLYWTDRGDFPYGNSLNRATISSFGSGQNQYEILARHMHDPIGLALEKGGHIVVSDMGGDIYKYSMDGKERSKMFEDQGVYTGIAVSQMPSEQAHALYGIGA